MMVYFRYSVDLYCDSIRIKKVRVITARTTQITVGFKVNKQLSSSRIHEKYDTNNNDSWMR